MALDSSDTRNTTAEATSDSVEMRPSEAFAARLSMMSFNDNPVAAALASIALVMWLPCTGPGLTALTRML